MELTDKRKLHWGFVIFGLWYAGFGLAALWPELNTPLFRVPVGTWDGMSRALLAFAGLYSLHVALWSLQLARMPREQTRQFAASLGLILTLLIPAFVSFLQWRWSVFTHLGLAAFSIDIVFGVYFLAGLRTSRKAGG